MCRQGGTNEGKTRPTCDPCRQESLPDGVNVLGTGYGHGQARRRILPYGRTGSPRSRGRQRRKKTKSRLPRRCFLALARTTLLAMTHSRYHLHSKGIAYWRARRRGRPTWRPPCHSSRTRSYAQKNRRSGERRSAIRKTVELVSPPTWRPSRSPISFSN